MKPPTKKNPKNQIALVVQLLVGLFLAFTTYDVLQLLHDSVHNEVLGWLSLSGIGVGVGATGMVLLLLVIGADIFWIIFFALWLLRKRMHIEPTDKTLRLP